MKYFSRILLAVLGSAMLFAACEKVEPLPNYSNGNAPTLTSSSATLTPTAADSNNVAVTFNWTSPNYATDPASYKFVLEIDLSKNNFSAPFQKTVTGALSTTLLAKELNAILINRYGSPYNTPIDLDVRVVSSYSNNNEQYKSNVVKIKASAYVTPPKVTLPSTGKLFLVGDASQGGWNNPVPVPTQEFAKLDSVTWGGVFNLNGGKEYLVLPENGSWSTKYSVADKTVNGLRTGGDFGFNLNDNFPGPSASGWYTIILNFQTGKFTVTPFTGTLPTDLFIVGDATQGGWNNPVPTPSQQLTRINSSVWEITLPLNGGKEYLLLPVNGSWSNKYAVADKGATGARASGPFGYNLNDNFPGPLNSGTYTISVNFVTSRYKVTP